MANHLKSSVFCFFSQLTLYVVCAVPYRLKVRLPELCEGPMMLGTQWLTIE